EQGDPRGELLRLSRALRGEPLTEAACGPRRLAWEGRLRELLASGMRPCVPVLTNGVGMELALIPAGKFLMGSPPDVAERSGDEGPQHEVEITRPFYLGVYPMTQGQWQRVMGSNPSHFSAGGVGKAKVRALDT